MTLESVTIKPSQPANGSVIWLHGLGADGHDFADIVAQLNLPENLSLRFIFPHAPIRPVAINANMRMRAWYDIYSLTDLENEDEAGIRETQQFIDKLIVQEKQHGIPSQRIVLAGFSQGGAMALYAGLHHAEPLAGILALSTYLPLMDSIASDADNTNYHTPIMMAHGRFDPVLPMTAGQRTFQRLQQAGYNIQWHDYPMEHQVCFEEITAISKWLCEVFSRVGNLKN